jgi:upstream activation factor subunit UAF30
MVKKTSVKSAETDQAAAAASVPVVPSVVEKKTKKTKSAKVEVSPVTNVVTANDNAVVEPVVTENEPPLTEQSIEFMAKLQQISLAISSLKNEFRTLEKKWVREVKTAQKQTNRRKRNGKNRAPSGFVKPTKISDELASFLGKDKGTEMARTDVTREINTYIRANKLQDKDNGRKINPDKKLASLLKLKTSDELTYFNLQKYMSPHFAKAVKDVAAVVV